MSNLPLPRCPECGAAMRREARADTVTHAGQSMVVDVPGWWCTRCDEAILDGEGLRIRERAFVELKATVDGVLGPSAVASVRGRLRLSQRRAGELLGGGPRAFQKYEAGTQAVSLPMSRLLTLLDNDPGRLTELTAGVQSTDGPTRAPSRSRTANSKRRPAAALGSRRGDGSR